MGPLVPTSPMATLPLASTVLTLLEPSTLPRGRLRPSPRLKLRLILTTDTATLELATLLLDTLVLATAVATTDMDTATALATDTLVRFTEPKEKRNSKRSANP